jgi:hypothetical protein
MRQDLIKSVQWHWKLMQKLGCAAALRCKNLISIESARKEFSPAAPAERAPFFHLLLINYINIFAVYRCSIASASSHCKQVTFS